MSTETRTILLGVTGSIAAYKAAELTRLMIRAGWNVHVVMTDGATRFVTPLTFRTLSRNPVGLSLFDDPVSWSPEHIALATQADLMLIAPCTANVIAKLAHGIADDLLTATALATRAPVVIAPAMNDGMWDNAATQANLDTLAQRGIAIIDPESGDLACGTQGNGRMADPETILEQIPNFLKC